MTINEKDIYIKFGQRIKELRNENHMTQNDLAQILNIGQATMAQYENGTRKIPLTLIRKLSDCFDMSLDELIGYDNGEKPENDFVIGENLKRLRREQHLTTAELSAEIGISPDMIRRYENGNDMPISAVIKFANFFNTSVDKLAGLTFGDDKNYTLVETNKLKLEGYKKWKSEIGDQSFTDEQIKELIQFAKFMVYRDSQK